MLELTRWLQDPEVFRFTLGFTPSGKFLSVNLLSRFLPMGSVYCLSFSCCRVKLLKIDIRRLPGAYDCGIMNTIATETTRKQIICWSGYFSLLSGLDLNPQPILKYRVNLHPGHIPYGLSGNCCGLHD